MVAPEALLESKKVAPPLSTVMRASPALLVCKNWMVPPFWAIRVALLAELLSWKNVKPVPLVVMVAVPAVLLSTNVVDPPSFVTSEALPAAAVP